MYTVILAVHDQEDAEFAVNVLVDGYGREETDYVPEYTAVNRGELPTLISCSVEEDQDIADLAIFAANFEGMWSLTVRKEG